ncbi:hypothetical protein Trydic_g20321 [Trypoxylus dichotomus]
MVRRLETKSRCLERKVLRKIYGPMQDPATNELRRRTNEDLEELYTDANIVQGIKAGGFRWAGHMQNQSDFRMARAWMTYPSGRRSLGRPHQR